MTPTPMTETPFFAEPARRIEFLDWLTEEEKAMAVVEVLESIKRDFGPLWAVYACGAVRPHALISEWLYELMDEQEGQ